MATKPNILIFAITDSGGAGKVTIDMALALIELGHYVEVFVNHKTTSFPFVKEVNRKKSSKKSILFKRLKHRIFMSANKAILKTHEEYYFYNTDEKYSSFSVSEITDQITFKPNYIVGTWISNFVNFETLGKLGKYYNAEVRLQMTDMGMITGGCHYSKSCEKYTSNCTDCPAIINSKKKHIAESNLRQRAKSIEKFGIKIIGGSEGTKEQAEKSTLFKNQKDFNIYNGIIDFNIFNPSKRDIAKRIFDIPENSKLIVCGAQNLQEERKGIKKLYEALKIIDANTQFTRDLYVILFGGNHYNNYLSLSSKIKFINMESISDKSYLSLLYQAADIYISPSIEDSGPSMVIQSLACGTPVVGFDIGFIKTFVKNYENGFVANNFESSELAKGIIEILELNNLSNACIDTVKKPFSLLQLTNIYK